MSNALLDGTVKDQNSIVVPGASVYVYDGRGEDGGLALLYDNLGQAVPNPVTTDDDGYWSAYAATDRFYTTAIYFGGRKRYVESNVLLGTYSINTDPNLRADLASAASGKGASLVAARAGGTAQDVFDSLLDLSTGQTLSGNTALASTDINTLVTLADGAANYTVNLPSVGSGDGGAAVKLSCTRDCSKVVTVAAASASGLLIDGEASVDLIAGESATAVFDGAKWRLLDRVRVPFAAEMRNSGATTLTVDAFNDIPFPAAGTQLMQADLKALWGYSGGYFTAPRAGSYEVTFNIWLSQTGGPSQIDIGIYQATSGGGTPASDGFGRVGVTDNTFQTSGYSKILSLGKGEKVFACIRPLGAANGGTLTACSVVDSATLLSRLSVAEIVR